MWEQVLTHPLGQYGSKSQLVYQQIGSRAAFEFLTSTEKAIWRGFGAGCAVASRPVKRARVVTCIVAESG